MRYLLKGTKIKLFYIRYDVLINVDVDEDLWGLQGNQQAMLKREKCG